ncbi:MAG: hypothetical protein ABI480_10555 [Chitinophagaceae bacterium]
MKKEKTHAWAEFAGAKINSAGLRIKGKVAGYLNKRFETVKPRKMKWLLLVFCICWGSLSVYFIWSALYGNGNKINVYKAEKIHSLKFFDKTGEPILEPLMDDSTYQKIQSYKKFMDSTGQTIRPSLLDSIQYLEELFKKEHAYDTK